jgi:hypothetical protein
VAFINFINETRSPRPAAIQGLPKGWFEWSIHQRREYLGITKADLSHSAIHSYLKPDSWHLGANSAEVHADEEDFERLSGDRFDSFWESRGDFLGQPTNSGGDVLGEDEK